MNYHGKRGLKNKGQITIFIILALLVVGIGIVIYLFFPQVKTTLGIGPKNPSEFLQTCMEDTIKEKVGEISIHGGSIQPEYYFLYEGEKVEYLCYTNEYYLPCTVQQPLLKQHVENEIAESMKKEADSCFSSMKKTYESQGYTAELTRGEISVELLPKRIAVSFTHKFTLTKQDTNQYDKFSVVLNNNLYELISIANSILIWETKYGDAETTTYMTYYRDLKVEKKKQSEGTKVYIITDRNTGNKFQFASRSVVWPPGYFG